MARGDLAGVPDLPPPIGGGQRLDRRETGALCHQVVDAGEYVADRQPPRLDRLVRLELELAAVDHRLLDIAMHEHICDQELVHPLRQNQTGVLASAQVYETTILGTSDSHPHVVRHEVVYALFQLDRASHRVLTDDEIPRPGPGARGLEDRWCWRYLCHLASFGRLLLCMSVVRQNSHIV